MKKKKKSTEKHISLDKWVTYSKPLFTNEQIKAFEKKIKAPKNSLKPSPYLKLIPHQIKSMRKTIEEIEVEDKIEDKIDLESEIIPKEITEKITPYNISILSPFTDTAFETNYYRGIQENIIQNFEPLNKSKKKDINDTTLEIE